ncbi:hypothetical protein ISU07_04575 [Nocardioides islandensis]|jgi:hypothetical protein|uniref:Uncharacterized protein n=1 Tax=Nocardioides islandensis TaxID=433663 RepID=A0A930YJ62_9ACTN|nr:hypothetical protein [Nocardioides islandensis]MBF4762390.1 hypothetical protein [Nocardioides islandensis]
MFVIGLLLMLFGALAIVGALFASSGTAEFLGIDVSAFGIFLIGLGAGVAILWGWTISKFGVKRSLQHRRESKQLQQLSEKLDRVDEEKSKDVDDNNAI